jgi:GTPase SAR1 family protein
MEGLSAVKLIVLGDSSVGKSTVIVKFTEETFNSNIGSTVGIELY